MIVIASSPHMHATADELGGLLPAQVERLTVATVDNLVESVRTLAAKLGVPYEEIEATTIEAAVEKLLAKSASFIIVTDGQCYAMAQLAARARTNGNEVLVHVKAWRQSTLW